MKDIKNICKIALVQAEPVMFNKSASLKKALQCINEAAIQKPDIIVFPELFIPGYPVGMNFGFSMGKRSVTPNNNQSELYFEEPDIEQFVERLETLYPEIEYVNHLMTHSWGQKVVRFYDFDGNLIEVGTPV